MAGCMRGTPIPLPAMGSAFWGEELSRVSRGRNVKGHADAEYAAYESSIQIGASDLDSGRGLTELSARPARHNSARHCKGAPGVGNGWNHPLALRTAWSGAAD